MRKLFISNVSRKTRRWLVLIGAGLSIYIIFTYVVTGNKSAVSLTEQRLNPSVDTLGRLHEKDVQAESNVIDTNNNAQREKQNNAEANEVNQPRIQNEANQPRDQNEANRPKDQNEANKPSDQIENNQPKDQIEGAQPSDQNEANQPIKQNEANQPRDQIEAVQQPQQVVLAKPPEVIIPHLYFNNEGRGQMGEPVAIDKNSLSQKEKEEYDRGYERNSFNEYVSNLISVDRKIAETRDPRCENQVFPTDLPDTSVIICFLNEAWSVLVRSVHSVINTTPDHLVREIILVDDNSDYEYLKAPLEVYMKKFPKVKIVRNSEREGLIRSRLNGAKVATGQVLTFLDSHIECAKDWLQPLLTRIKENSSHVVWPYIPVIDVDTFQFPAHRKADDLQMGIFSWHMNFGWEDAKLENRETAISPIKSPTMAGGLFSIDRKYFYDVGSYDDEMRFWGAENLEMSFRIWMCGGSIEIIPCSVIGHIYRARNPNAHGNSGAILRNTVRTAIVWMDQYKHLYAKVARVRLENYGDISNRLELREKLHCKSFDWYLNHIYPNVFRPENAQVIGLIHSVHDSSHCLEADDNRNAPIRIRLCNAKDFRRQVFYKTEYEEIRLISTCLDAGGKDPMMYSCHRMKGNQHFLYRPDHTIYFAGNKKCLQWRPDTKDVGLLPCDGNPRQLWMWEKVSVGFLYEPEENSDKPVENLDKPAENSDTDNDEGDR